MALRLNPIEVFMRSSSLSLLFLLARVHAWAAVVRRRLPGYRFEFPRDHFGHPDYQTEWWYYTGNLRASGWAPIWVRVDVLSARGEPVLTPKAAEAGIQRGGRISCIWRIWR